ncbi:aspartate-semialdehyde dehydrogenase [Candidatus Fermentibacteria bacterium]|nr:aspartate-semialdehyde dehydrogenase [Candidatus Fermentibacteria bacterium]
MGSIGIVGATGLVGTKMMEIIHQRNVFDGFRISAFASASSAGTTVQLGDREVSVERLQTETIEPGTVLLGATEAEVALRWVPECVEKGAVVVDNSSAYRMDDDVPLVVPEVNAHALVGHKGIVANPNCSTIQLVMVLAPLSDLSPIEWVCVSTYQSVSGSGRQAMEDLFSQEAGEECSEGAPVYHRNVLTEIGTPEDDGYCREETKLIRETAKILRQEFPVFPAAARVPVPVGHTESVTVCFAGPVDPEDAYSVLDETAGVRASSGGLSPSEATGKDEVFVGRIRRHPHHANVVQFWITADNLRKGAALNAVQIAEEILASEAI